MKFKQVKVLMKAVANGANNEEQAGGHTASHRMIGRSTNPLPLAFDQNLAQLHVMKPDELIQVQRIACEALRSAANDRAFQALLVKQLSPQARTQQPPPGSWVYYRRPPTKQSPEVYRGPAEVLACSLHGACAFLQHGGALIRAAFEDCMPVTWDDNEALQLNGFIAKGERLLSHLIEEAFVFLRRKYPEWPTLLSERVASSSAVMLELREKPLHFWLVAAKI